VEIPDGGGGAISNFRNVNILELINTGEPAIGCQEKICRAKNMPSTDMNSPCIFYDRSFLQSAGRRRRETAVFS